MKWLKLLSILGLLASAAYAASPNTTQVPGSLWTTPCAAGTIIEGNGAGLITVCGPVAGTAAAANTGTSLHTIPYLDGTNAWSATNNFTGGLQINGNAINASGGVVSPTTTRAGDIIVWNGTAWVTIVGNNSGTQVLSENASGTPAWITASGTGTVTSITCGGGLSCTSTNPITSSGTIDLTPGRKTNPTKQVFTTGSGTYTTPANVLWIEIDIQGGGGGGGGGGTSAASGGAGGNTCWNTTGAACTTPVYQAGGGLGGPGATVSVQAGGTVSGSGTCDWSTTGGSGFGGGQSTSGGIVSAFGVGGSSVYGGTGALGSGGFGGGAGNSATLSGGIGGGAGAHCHVIINAPAATYTYAIGAAGTAGGAGTGGNAGGAGGAGIIIVYEHYGS